jgi:Tfp pilus assembly protein PilF
MASYNAGLIADRLRQAEQAVMHLENALTAGIPHSRYRLLTRLWLARNHYRQGNIEIAQQQLDLMSNHRDGLEDWQIVLASEQAAPLRRLLEADVHLAESILEHEASLKDLNGE